MWDWNSRQPNGVADNTTGELFRFRWLNGIHDFVCVGDIVDLQYFLYKEDVARVAALGVNAHSFS